MFCLLNPSLKERLNQRLSLIGISSVFTDKVKPEQIIVGIKNDFNQAVVSILQFDNDDDFCNIIECGFNPEKNYMEFNYAKASENSTQIKIDTMDDLNNFTENNNTQYHSFDDICSKIISDDYYSFILLSEKTNMRRIIVKHKKSVNINSDIHIYEYSDRCALVWNSLLSDYTKEDFNKFIELIDNKKDMNLVTDKSIDN